MRTMLFPCVIAGALATAALPVLARGADDYGDQEPVSVAHLVLTGGLTYGGDQLEQIQYDTGDSYNIHAGALYQLGFGTLLVNPNAPVSLQLTINYQADEADANNGTATFSRFPLEATVFYDAIDRWRFGAGVRYTTDVRLHGLEYAGGDHVDFKDTVGGLVNVGYQLTPNVWLEGRYVVERFRPESTPLIQYNGASVSGNHAGVFITGIW